MAQIPKIGLQRLQKGAELQAHPDAELIAAFIENSTTRRERTDILDHLAQCYECREIVSLALPERMEVEKSRGASRWLSWPVLRWAGAAACVVVVGMAVTLHYESRSRSAQVNTQPVEVATLDGKVAEPPSPGPAIDQPTNKTAEGLNPERNPAPVRKKKATEGANSNSISINQTADIAQGGPEPEAQLQGAETLEARTPPAAAPPVNEGIVPGRAKLAEPTIAMDNIAEAAKRQATALSGSSAIVASRARLVPRWALNSDGSLQRSRDGGSTWEIVSVAPQSRLRALAAIGFDIWVGGSGGALYHSVDAGQHWSQVRPVADGEALTADIIGVEFPDPQHGKISTSSLETWTTDDAGQHWQKQ